MLQKRLGPLMVGGSRVTTARAEDLSGMKIIEFGVRCIDAACAAAEL